MVVGLNNRILKLKNDSNLPIPLQQMPPSLYSTITFHQHRQALKLSKFDVFPIKVLHLYDTLSNHPYKTHILHMHFSEIATSTYKHTT